jgi:phospholipid/cholesterol/gamma-HCH transport system substrate-binding protein
MKNTKLELSVGIFVILGIAAIAYMAIKLGTGSMVGGDTYLIETRFANAGGVHAGSSVLMSGVTVGRVEGVRMEPSDYSAIVTLRILSRLKLPTDSMASVKTSGLIGDKYVALSPGAEEEYLNPGERITMTESAVDLESLIGKMAFGSVSKNDKETKEKDSKETKEKVKKTNP